MTDNTVGSVESVNMENAAPAQQPDFEQERQRIAEQSFKAGHAKGIKEAEARRMAEQNQSQSASYGQETQNVNQQNDAQAPSVDDLVNQALERIEQQRQAEEQTRVAEEQRHRGEQILQSLDRKISDAKGEIPDIESVITSFDWGQAPQLLGLTDDFDNSAHMLHHLAKDHLKIGALMSLPPSSQKAELQRLSDSLRINKDAKASSANIPTDTLSRMNTSAVSVGNGERTVSDYKRDPRYRG